LLPGFIGLAGVVPFAPVIASWLRPMGYTEANLGPPVYALLAATTVGMIINCLRWILVDQLHHATGITPPAWDDSRLEERLSAFNYLVEQHYRYHQFVGNTLVAIVFAYLVNRIMGSSSLFGFGTDIGVILLCAALFAGSRDALHKYYTRTSRLVGRSKSQHSKE